MSTSNSVSPTVEVVATLGDTIVGVRHVSNPRGGSLSAATRLLLVGGATMIAVAAIAFAVITHRAAADAEAYTAWVESGASPWAFRHELGSTTLSLLAVMGVSAGLASLVAGLLRRRLELLPSTVSIGSARGVDFATMGTLRPLQNLVAPTADRDGFVVDLAGVGGELWSTDGGHVTVPVDGKGAIAMRAGTTVSTKIGQVNFVVRSVDTATAMPPPPWMGERRSFGYVAGTALVAASLLLLAWTTEPDALMSNADRDEQELIAGTLVRTEHDDAPPPEQTESTDAGGDVGAVAAMKLAEGATGADVATPDSGRRQIAQRSTSEARASERDQAISDAATAGIMGSTMLAQLSNLGSDAISSGFDSLDLVGSLDGTGVGAPQGFGDGRKGIGPGAGGTEWGTARVGSYHTIDGGAVDGGYLPGDGVGIKDRSHKEVKPLILGKPQVSDIDIDKEMISRHVKRAQGKLSYCYEKSLMANPELAGTISSKFTINQQGVVIAATAKGFDETVSSCVASVIRTIKFPALPVSATINYPFTFRKSAN